MRIRHIALLTNDPPKLAEFYCNAFGMKEVSRSGEKQDRTEWHNIVAFGKLAEICGQYLRKGKLVYIDGSIHYDSWDDKETGQKKYRTEITANTMKMLDRKGDGEGGGGAYAGERKGGSSHAEIEDDDEVPF